MATARTWQLKFHTCQVLDAQENKFPNGGDQPYFVFFGFRSRIKAPGSTQVFWSKYLSADWAKGVTDESPRQIPSQMGTVTFPNVTLPAAAEITKSGQAPELLGVVGIAVEHDKTPLSSVKTLMNEIRVAIHADVKRIVEDAPFDPANPGPALRQAVQKIGESVGPRAHLMFKSSPGPFAEGDDLIGVRVQTFVAGDPSLKPVVPQTEFLEQKSVQLNFAGDGAHYRVHGAAEMAPIYPELAKWRYDAIWVPGGDGRPILYDWALAGFQQKDGEFRKAGFRLMHQHSYDIGGGQRRYDGIWTPGGDGRPIVWGWTLADFQKKNDELFKTGFRLMHQHSYDIGEGQRRYDGIWALGGDNRPVVWGWAFADFKWKNDELFKAGFRLSHQHSYDIGGGQRRYDGIWVPGGDSRPVVWGWTLADFQKKHGEMFQAGFRLMHQHSYDIGGGQLRYDGIWAPGSDGRPVIWGWTAEDFERRSGELFGQGYRLAHFHNYRVG